MKQYQDEAFVLGYEQLEEVDRRYIVFTYSFGKLPLLAKGSRKILSKLAGYLEPPALVEVIFTTVHQPRLISAVEKEAFSNIKRNPVALSLSLDMLKLFNEFTIFQQPDSALWQLLYNTFYFLEANINQAPEVAEFLKYYFPAQLLKISGFSPLLDGCAVCGLSRKPVYFSWAKRGVVCSLHREKGDLKLSQRQMKVLQALFNFPLNAFKKRRLVKTILQERIFLDFFLRKLTFLIKSDVL